MQMCLLSVFPHPKAPIFELCMDGVAGWRCAKYGGKGGHWYMGEVIPRECVTNMLFKNNHMGSLLSSDRSWERLVWERMQGLCAVDHAVVASATAVDQMRGDEKEEDKGEGMEQAIGNCSCSTKDLAPKQVPAPQVTMPVAPKFWAVGPSVRMARGGCPLAQRPG